MVCVCVENTKERERVTTVSVCVCVGNTKAERERVTIVSGVCMCREH